MNIIVDEDLPVAAAELLRARGHIAEHVREIGLSGEKDSRVLSAAKERGAILLTADLDFGNLLNYPIGSHNGVILLRFPDYFRRDQILSLLRRFLDAADIETLSGALVIVESGSYRIRRC